MPRNKELTTTEKNVLLRYREEFDATGEPPNITAMARDLKMQRSSVVYAIKTLKEKGYMQDKRITVVRLTPSAKGRKVAP